MFSPYRVWAVAEDGEVLEVREVSDSHEKQDMEAHLSAKFPKAKIESEPR